MELKLTDNAPLDTRYDILVRVISYAFSLIQRIIIRPYSFLETGT